MHHCGSSSLLCIICRNYTPSPFNVLGNGTLFMSRLSTGFARKTRMASNPVWVFGYGSIIWKVDFSTVDSCIGHVRGYVRRFYQGSTDHRGTPGNPGRVVTLLPSANLNDEVWGVAYRIPDNEVEKIIAQLDYREKGGFTRTRTLFFPKNPKLGPFETIVYVAVEGNVNYLGPAPLDEIARTIAFSKGPSGPNVDYLFNLCKAMREIAPSVKDEHLLQLETRVRELLEAHVANSVTHIRDASVAPRGDAIKTVV